MRVKAIRTEADHKAALERIDALMEASAGTAAGDELDVLVDLVEHYEEKHVPMGFPTPVAAIEFRMDQAGLTPRDLVPYIGSRAKVSEVLSGKRTLTMRMARALHEHLGIPADVLLQQDDEPELGPSESTDWNRFPVSEMVKLGWLPKAARSVGRAGKYLKDLIRRAGCAEVQPTALYRKNDRSRVNAKSDAWALQAWCWQALATAEASRPRKPYSRGTVTPGFLRQVVQLSVNDDGPVQASQFLAKHGIPLVTVRHLNRTYLDGAVLKLADGTPVVALTLRYDRIDNFWFCLLHELAHVGRHLDGGKDTVFVDDLNLQAVDVKESEADAWALEAAIPREAWESSSVQERPTPMAVVQFANKLHIHPAIVAGRVRFERKNFRMLSHFVGNGEIRRHFGLN